MTAGAIPVRCFESRAEVRNLSSVTRDGVPMFFGPQLFIWVRPPHFPWLLAGIKPLRDGGAA